MGRSTVCIGMPVHNGGQYLPKAIESLLGQSYDSFHLVILDDGSTDHSSQIIQEYIKQDNRISYFKNPLCTGLINAWRTVAEIGIPRLPTKMVCLVL